MELWHLGLQICGKNDEAQFYANETLGALVAKFVFRKEALASLKQMSQFTDTSHATENVKVTPATSADNHTNTHVQSDEHHVGPNNEA